MKQSRSLILLLVALLGLSAVLAACGATQTTTASTAATTSATAAAKANVRVAALKGPTGIGLVKIMNDQEKGQAANNYTFSLFGTPDDIVAQLSSGQADIAALPTNLAATLYQKTNQQIQILAINTLGVLYILEKGNTIHAMGDLAGKTIQATGQASVPEYVLNELLAKSNLPAPATVEYKTEHSELATLAVAGKADLVMLPEPFVTTVLSKNSEFRIALDLTAEWQKIQKAAGKTSELSMGCLVVTAAFAKSHAAAIQSFMQEYKLSTDYVNANPVEAGAAVARFQIMADAGQAAKAIPNCHIVMIQGQAMQSTLQPFLEILYAANPKSVGGKLPDASFYWLP